jgi:hypothetical protein
MYFVYYREKSEILGLSLPTGLERFPLHAGNILYYSAKDIYGHLIFAHISYLLQIVAVHKFHVIISFTL